MSGPKLSKAKLEKMRQEALARQREEMLRQLRIAQGTYRTACNAIDEFKKNVWEIVQQCDWETLDFKRETLVQELDELQYISVGNRSDKEAYYVAAEEMNRQLKKKEEKNYKMISSLIAMTKNLQNIKNNQKDIKNFQDAFDHKQDIVRSVSIDFRCQKDKTILLQEMAKLLAHFQNNTRDNIISKFSLEKAKELQAIREQVLQWKDYTEDMLYQVYQSMQNMINEEVEEIRLGKEKNELYEQYLALAAVNQIHPIGPGGFESTEKLREAIKRLQYQYQKQDEMNYIADQINEVMIDLGFDIVSTEVLQKDDSQMDYSLYQADKDSGIAIYTNDSGLVMMRMTVLGDGGPIMEEDKELSYQRQIDFCSAHPEIVQAIREKGIILKQNSYCSPSKDYTYKVDVKKKKADSVQKNGTTKKIKRRGRRHGKDQKMRAL
ncbi:MAG: hypothetical protein ACOX1S_03975 [Anaerostipes sp.]|jgi:hypothetical protein